METTAQPAVSGLVLQLAPVVKGVTAKEGERLQLIQDHGTSLFLVLLIPPTWPPPPSLPFYVNRVQSADVIEGTLRKKTICAFMTQARKRSGVGNEIQQRQEHGFYLKGLFLMSPSRVGLRFWFFKMCFTAAVETHSACLKT